MLTVSVLISLASCSKQTPAKERKIISAESPWFNAETIEVSTGVDADRDVDYLLFALAEYLLSLSYGGGVIEVDDGVLAALQRFKGLFDDVLS